MAVDLKYKHKKGTYEEMIEWLETHKCKTPRSAIRRQGKKLKAEEMTQKEKEEVNLYQRWKGSKEYKILQEYEGKPIEEVPEEFREKAAKLISYGLGLKQKTTYEEIIEWRETHKRKMPRGNISKQGKKLRAEEMTQEEKKEVDLYARWIYSKEYKTLKEYEGKPIEEVPEEYREKIAKLRSYELTTYEEIIEWLETHEWTMPRPNISKQGKRLRVKDMTQKEKDEVNLYQRWQGSEEFKILQAYKGKPIEKVPEEYREKIAELRELMQKEKDRQIINTMRKTVGHHVGNNEETRQELNRQIKKEKIRI